jgi:sugar phosphate isomerase/epimerase
MKNKMTFGYSTLGGADLSLEQAVQLAEKYGLQFLELRALEMNLDLAAYFREKGLPSKEMLARMPVQSLCSSLKLTSAAPADLEKFLEMAELADQLQTPYIRVFGGGEWGEPITNEMLDHAAKIVEQIHAEFKSKSRRVQIALETHDAFCSSSKCMQLLKHVQPPIYMLWDTHHTWRLAGESPQESWDIMGHLIRHVHYKDSLPTPAHSRPYKLVLPGAGQYPATALFDVLRAKGFSGGVSLEWERLWIKELESLEEAIAAFLGVLKAANAKD